MFAAPPRHGEGSDPVLLLAEASLACDRDLARDGVSIATGGLFIAPTQMIPAGFCGEQQSCCPGFGP